MVLGDHIAQKGSLVGPDRMRFDVSHPKQITPEQIRQVEDIVNTQIRNNLQVNTVIMNKDEAVKQGATALFDENTPAELIMVSMTPCTMLKIASINSSP